MFKELVNAVSSFVLDIFKKEEELVMNRVCYLAGPIQGITKEDAKGWRDTLTLALKDMNIDVLDPTRNQHLKRFEDGSWNKEAIVELDLQDLDQSEFLIAYTPFPSVGTSMEIYHTKAVLKKKVFIVCDDITTISPWIEYHADKVFDSFTELIEYLTVNI